MRHVPHILLPGPWSASTLELSEAQAHHVVRVLRLSPGASVSYTDGAGHWGRGTLRGLSVERGDEHDVEPPAPPVELAVAPPRSVRRQRFLVEKLAELGVDRLTWIITDRTEGRPPRPAKVRSWAVAALEQSGGAWLMDVPEATTLQQLTRNPRELTTLWVAERETNLPPSVVAGGMIVIGPEGGLDRGEVPETASAFGLGTRVLRTETAAVIAAALFLERCGRLD